GLRREYEAEIGDRAGQVEHGERERDAHHPGAELRGRLPDEEEAEVPLPKGAEPAQEPHGLPAGGWSSAGRPRSARARRLPRAPAPAQACRAAAPGGGAT